jgi:RNA polymerase sigma-54 factor
MRAAQRIQHRTAQKQRISPRLIAAAAILQMSSEELQAHVEQEASVNPALEIAIEQTCPTCGRALANATCWLCDSTNGDRDPSPDVSDVLPLPSGQPRWDADDDPYDPLEHASAPVTLQDHVLMQAGCVVSPHDMPIAEYLIAELNDDGLIEVPPQETAEDLDVELARVLSVLSRLQRLEPPGVCACSVQESLLIQLQGLAAENGVPKLAEPILSAHWRDLANHAYRKISHALSATPEAVEEAVSFIRGNLHPYPGRLYRDPYEKQRRPRLGVLRPDVIIRRTFADYEVEVVRPFDYELRVSEAYRRLCAANSNGNGRSPQHVMAAEQYRRASWLLQNLALRGQTLREIAEVIVVCQRPFLDTESGQKMQPLTRTEVAQRIGKHASTVSRAISGKFVLLPSENLLPFEKFFASAVAPKTVVSELLANEDPSSPLTDEQICRVLRVRGFQIARRTVAKYRLALRLPSSIQRGRH